MSFFQPTFIAGLSPVRVRFGESAIAVVAEEVAALDSRHALVLSTPQQEDTAHAFATALGPLCAGVLAEARMHTPVEITEAALEHLRTAGADCLVAVGGGSTIGLSKALALRTGLPQIAVPTTYAGSEATPILGQTEGGRKTTLSDPRVLPRVIVYDPALVASLPVPLTLASGLNAMAHAAEALYARDRNPLSSVLAAEALAAMVGALPRVVADPANLTARGETLYGAWLCGTVLGQVGMALHHKLCHALGGAFDLPHAETHAVLLPHTLAFNAIAVPDLLAPLARLLGGPVGPSLHAFAARLGAPLALRDLGLAEADLDRATVIACENPYWNPREITRDGIRTMLHSAWKGEPPVT